jgi:hypothetical protein
MAFNHAFTDVVFCHILIKMVDDEEIPIEVRANICLELLPYFYQKKNEVLNKPQTEVV